MEDMMDTTGIHNIKFLIDDVIEYCPSTFAFPSHPIALNHVHFFYLTAPKYFNPLWPDVDYR
jgi:hypothetical protein